MECWSLSCRWVTLSCLNLKVLGFQFLFVIPVIELPSQRGRGKGEE